MDINESDNNCQFFSGKRSITQYFFREEYMEGSQFDDLLEKGFRKFGGFFFRYSCSCERCRPIRVNLGEFKISRSQKRVIKKNSQTVFRISPLAFRQDHFDLYKKHSVMRFNIEPENIDEFIKTFYISPVNSFMSEIFIDGKLAGVGYLDEGEVSLSSVYFVYDTDYMVLSPGVFSVIKEIEFAISKNKKYYYLGYYTRNKNFSEYKLNFKPNELFDIKTDKWNIL
jgi:leucyl-tRNA---protein transferase